MANELVGSVTATPTGPVTIQVGQTIAFTMRYTLNGPPPGSPSASTYSLSLQKVSPSPPQSVGLPHIPAAANTDYETTADIFSSGGTYVLRARGYVQYTPFADQEVFSEDITVHVMREVREVEATLPDRTVTAGLESRTVEASLPSREVVAGLETRTVDATLPARTVTAGVVD